MKKALKKEKGKSKMIWREMKKDQDWVLWQSGVPRGIKGKEEEEHDKEKKRKKKKKKKKKNKKKTR